MNRVSAAIPNESLEEILRVRSVAFRVEYCRGVPVTMRFDPPDSASVREGCDFRWRLDTRRNRLAAA
jgi:hypothetical protein